MLRPWLINFDLDDNTDGQLLYRRLADKILSLIWNGTLKAGEALPSSRELSKRLNVSRKTIVNATDSLLLTGWLVNKERVGLFVSDKILSRQQAQTPSDAAAVPANTPKRMLVLDDGLPDTSIAPVLELARAYRQILNRAAKWKVLGLSNPAGFGKFRQSLSSMLNHERGFHTNMNQVCVTRGSQMGLYLIAHAVFHPGDTVVIEKPCYERALATFSTAGLNVIEIAVDQSGIDTDKLEQVLQQHPVKGVYVTPRHHYPTMVELSADRREKLVQLALKYQFYVIEDDYDYVYSKSRFDTHPISASMPIDRILYLGTFSKVLAAAIRVGYLVTSEHLIQQIGEYRSLIDLQGDNVMEQATLELIESGDVQRHIKRSFVYYEEKKAKFLEQLHETLGEKVHVTPSRGGLAIWVSFQTQHTSVQIQEALVGRGIKARVVDDWQQRPGMRIGYATLSQISFQHLLDTLHAIL